MVSVHIDATFVLLTITWIHADKCDQNLVQDAIDEKRREVVVKALFPGTSELSVIEYLVNRRKTDPDSRDHTIPFLHLIYTPDCVLAVMPCWGTDYSSFLRVDEPIEKLRQCLEVHSFARVGDSVLTFTCQGLCYLHANRIAHGVRHTTRRIHVIKQSKVLTVCRISRT